MVQIHVRFTKDDLAIIDAYAKLNGGSRADALRRMVRGKGEHPLSVMARENAAAAREKRLEQEARAYAAAQNKLAKEASAQARKYVSDNRRAVLEQREHRKIFVATVTKARPRQGSTADPP